MQPLRAVDPTNPPGTPSDEGRARAARLARNITVLKMIASAAGASALTAIIIASCHDRDAARRDMREPGHVETTSATATATDAAVPQPGAPAPRATEDAARTGQAPAAPAQGDQGGVSFTVGGARPARGARGAREEGDEGGVRITVGGARGTAAPSPGAEGGVPPDAAPGASPSAR